MWPEEAASLVAEGRSLEELFGVGPNIARRITGWLEAPPRDLEPPGERRDFLTGARARALIDQAPEALGDLRSDLQMHTQASDGRLTLQEVALALQTRGYEYGAITDHSAGQRIPRGLPADALLDQGREIDELNAVLQDAGAELQLLRSLEMNLTPAGEGDTDPTVLKRLDLVLGSFHSSLRTTADQTDRYVAALENPDIHVLAHPRGRKYDLRLGLTADWPRVFDTATALGKAMEINASPDRQDLNVELLRVARDAGTLITIGTDAHFEHEFDYVIFGVAAALAADVPRTQILNYRTRPEIIEWAQGDA